MCYERSAEAGEISVGLRTEAPSCWKSGFESQPLRSAWGRLTVGRQLQAAGNVGYVGVSSVGERLPVEQV